MSQQGNSDDDPLENLFVSKDQVNRERLSKALEDLIGIDPEEGEVVPKSLYYDLNTRQKMVSLLLARKAAELVDAIEQSDVGMSSSEIGNLVNSSDSTVRKYVSSDKFHFIVRDNEHGGYYIPDHSINEAIEYLSPNE